MLLLANVSVARVAASCEPATGHAGARAAEAAAQEHAGHYRSHHEQTPEPDDPPPDDPPPDAAQCCQAMTSCVSTPDVAAAGRAEPAAPCSVGVTTAVDFRPESRTTTPDTPPPRA